MANTPEKRTPGRISNLRAMFETGNSPSPLSSPTPDARPKPLSRVKTSFVAIGGSQGLGLGLQKAETPDKEKSTDELVDKTKIDNGEEAKTEIVKDDKTTTKPDVVVIEKEAEKLSTNTEEVKQDLQESIEPTEAAAHSVDETPKDKPIEQSVEAKETLVDPALIQSKDAKAIDSEIDTAPEPESQAEEKESSTQEITKEEVTKDIQASEETHKEPPTASESLESVPGEEKPEDPLVVAKAGSLNGALVVESEKPVAPESDARVGHADPQVEEFKSSVLEIPSVMEEIHAVPAADDETLVSTQEFKPEGSSDTSIDDQMTKQEESQAAVEESNNDLKDVEPSTQVTTEPEPTPQPEIAQEKETVPDVEELVPDATLAQGSSSAEKVGVIPEEKKPEVLAEPTVEKSDEILSETKAETTSPPKSKKNKKGKKSKAAQEPLTDPQAAPAAASQPEVEQAEEATHLSPTTPKEVTSSKSPEIDLEKEPEAPILDEFVHSPVTPVKDETDTTKTTTPAIVDEASQNEEVEKKEVTEPVAESSKPIDDEKDALVTTDILPESVKEEILDRKEDSESEAQEDKADAEETKLVDTSEPEVSTKADPVVEEAVTREETKDTVPVLSDAATDKDAIADQEVTQESTESVLESVSEEDAQVDAEKQSASIEDTPMEDRPHAPVVIKQGSPKAVKKPLSTSKVSDKKVLKPTTSSSSQPSPSTKPSTIPAPLVKKAPVPKAPLSSTRKPVETSNKPKVPEQTSKISKPLVSTSKKPEAKKPVSPAPPPAPVDENITDPTSITASSGDVPESSDEKSKPAVDTSLMPPPASPATKISPPLEKKPLMKPKSSHSRTSSLAKNDITSVESPPKVTVRQRPISAYAPTSSSSSKTLVVKEAIKPVVKSSRSPSRLAALSNSTGRPSSRASNAHAPSPSRNEPRVGDRQFSSRQSMTSEMNIQSRTTKPIDSDFLARLSRPTASSASKMVEKNTIVLSHPAPHLPKKHSTSQTRRKGDQDSHKDGDVGNGSDEHDVEEQTSEVVDENNTDNNTQTVEVSNSDGNDQSATQ